VSSAAIESTGKIIAVWSASGSVGRSALVSTFACEVAKTSKSVLLIDADVYGPSLIQHFGFDQNYSGISAAMRLVDQGRLDDEGFNRLLIDYQLPKQSLKLLAGLTMVNRWPEIGFERIRELLEFAAKRFDFVFVDVATNLETDTVDAQLLSARNSTTLGVLSAANQVVAVCSADVIGINRLVWAMQTLRELKLSASIHVLVNRLNQSTLGRKAAAEIATSIRTLAECEVEAFIDEDSALFGRALADGVPATLVGRNSSAKQQIAKFALGQLLELPSKSKRRVAKLG
jgi:MinD-like ATPase involved in chromosome partitioning or flagellar assembly